VLSTLPVPIRLSDADRERGTESSSLSSPVSCVDSSDVKDSSPSGSDVFDLVDLPESKVFVLILRPERLDVEPVELLVSLRVAGVNVAKESVCSGRGRYVILLEMLLASH